MYIEVGVGEEVDSIHVGRNRPRFIALELRSRSRGMFMVHCNLSRFLNYASGSDESTRSDAEDEEAEGAEDIEGDAPSEEDEAHKAHIRPYHVLLQSLKSNELQGQSQRKKRRVDHVDSLKHGAEEDLTLASSIANNDDNASDMTEGSAEGPSPTAEHLTGETEADDKKDGTVIFLTMGKQTD